MGLDSLMGVELVVALENRFGIRLPVMALNESPTLAKLAGRLIQLLRNDGQPAGQDALLAPVEQLVSQHTDEVPAEAMAKFADDQIGRALVSTPVTNAHLVRRLLLDKTNTR